MFGGWSTKLMHTGATERAAVKPKQAKGSRFMNMLANAQ